MGNELYINIHPDVIVEPEELLANFPFEDGQSITSGYGGVVVIDLADQEDTTYLQDWFLNGHEDVLSFFVMED